MTQNRSIQRVPCSRPPGVSMLSSLQDMLTRYCGESMPPQHTGITVGFFHRYSYTQLR
jgi:hypothetical protein